VLKGPRKRRFGGEEGRIFENNRFNFSSPILAAPASCDGLET
jgi:hypothetical protein